MGQEKERKKETQQIKDELSVPCPTKFNNNDNNNNNSSSDNNNSSSIKDEHSTPCLATEPKLPTSVRPLDRIQLRFKALVKKPDHE